MTRIWKELTGGKVFVAQESYHDGSKPIIHLRLIQDDRTISTELSLEDFLREVDFGLLRKHAEWEATWHGNMLPLATKAVSEKRDELKEAQTGNGFSVEGAQEILAKAMESERKEEMSLAYYKSFAKVAGAMADFYESQSEETSK